MADQRIHVDGIVQKFRDISVFEGFNPGTAYAREGIAVSELEEKTREGEAWVLSHVWTALGPGAADFICLTTGDRTLHVRATGAASDLAWIAVSEGSEWTGGTPLTPHCLNRQVQVPHGLQVAIITPAGWVNGGVAMWTGIIDDGSGWAALGGDFSENPTWVLAPNSNYHFSIASQIAQGTIHAALTLLLLVY